MSETECVDVVEYGHRATYCPEDNKIRFYPDWNDPEFDKEIVKAAGYRWASKQECYVCPKWSTKAEDIALRFCGDLEDEDYSPEERAADRADRFGGYRDKRRSEAGDLADRYDKGDSAVGYQNQRRAERAAARRDRVRDSALSQWSKAEYWQQRTAGVIRNSLHRSSAPVRRERILRLEAELRGIERDVEAAMERFRAWQRVAETTDPQKQTELAIRVAGSISSWSEFPHPDDPSHVQSLYTLLVPFGGGDPRPITGAEAASLYLADRKEPGSEGTTLYRWKQHLEFRLIYERGMLENEGGSAADVEMEPGGFIGGHQIQKVNRSRATGKVVSVGLLSKHPRKKDADGNPLMVVQSVNIQRLGESAYRSPTSEERKAFEAAQLASKEEAKRNPKAPSLINPTEEDAQALQDIWNNRAKHPSEIWRMTQAEFSARLKSSCETVVIGEKGLPIRTTLMGSQVDGRHGVFKVRQGFSGSNFSAAHRVIVLTDKSQRPFPWGEMERIRAEMPTEEQLLPVFAEIVQSTGNVLWNQNEETRRLVYDAEYIGWLKVQSTSQVQLTNAGAEALKRSREMAAQSVEA